MLIGLFTALAMALFIGGGQQSFFLNPEVKKDIKVYVMDKARQKEIYSIIDAMEKDQKAFTKQKNKYYEKEAAALNKNYNAKREDFDTLFSKYGAERKALQLKSWENETKIRLIITDDEWNQMMTNLLVKPDKEKAQKGFEKLGEKMFGDIETSCKKVISDTLACSNALKAIDDQRILIGKILGEYLNLDYYHAESLRNKNASLEDFETVTENINTLRFTILTHYFDLRFDLIKAVTEEEWSKLSKEFTKVFIQGKGINKIKLS